MVVVSATLRVVVGTAGVNAKQLTVPATATPGQTPATSCMVSRTTVRVPANAGIAATAVTAATGAVVFTQPTMTGLVGHCPEVVIGTVRRSTVGLVQEPDTNVRPAPGTGFGEQEPASPILTRRVGEVVTEQVPATNTRLPVKGGDIANVGPVDAHPAPLVAVPEKLALVILRDDALNTVQVAPPLGKPVQLPILSV